MALADRDQIAFEAELLYVASLLHDIGLVEEFDTGPCFEEDSAAAATRLATLEGWPPERSHALAEAIRLHVATNVELGDGPEAFLLWHSTALDVGGDRYGDVSPPTVSAVLAAYPRLDFKEGFTGLLADQAERKPGCWAARAMQGGLRERITAAPFES